MFLSFTDQPALPAFLQDCTLHHFTPKGGFSILFTGPNQVYDSFITVDPPPSGDLQARKTIASWINNRAPPPRTQHGPKDKRVKDADQIRIFILQIRGEGRDYLVFGPISQVPWAKNWWMEHPPFGSEIGVMTPPTNTPSFWIQHVIYTWPQVASMLHPKGTCHRPASDHPGPSTQWHNPAGTWLSEWRHTRQIS